MGESLSVYGRALFFCQSFFPAGRLCVQWPVFWVETGLCFGGLNYEQEKMADTGCYGST